MAYGMLHILNWEQHQTPIPCNLIMHMHDLLTECGFENII